MNIKPGIKYYSNIEIIDFHSSGKSIARLGKHNIYLEKGIVGEFVNIEVPKHQKKNYISGLITEIIDTSPFRVNPTCKHFNDCGGCNWMHINYSQQLIWKRHLIHKAFAKYQIPYSSVAETIPSPTIFEYRNKLDFALYNDTKNSVYTGFHPIEKAGEIIPIDLCLLMPPEISKIPELMINLLQKDKAFDNILSSGLLQGISLRKTMTEKSMIVLHFKQHNDEVVQPIMTFVKNQFPFITSLYYTYPEQEDNNRQGKVWIHYHKDKYLIEKINDLYFRISPDSFFQPNSYQASQLFNYVLEIANPSNNDIIYDLYTGVGTLALHVAKKANHVIGIEGSQNAISDAIYNSQANEITNTTFIAGDVLETYKPSSVLKYGKPSIVILDPPRSGTLIETLKTIKWSEPDKIIYVSCNPVSLAWNLTYLVDKYRIESVVPFDMFPHTHHVETVVLLTKK